MSDKKQTAVDWLIEQYQKMRENGDNDMRTVIHFAEKAKAMEKEQHEETWFDSTKQFDNAAEMVYKKEFEDYYNETFEKQP